MAGIKSELNNPDNSLPFHIRAAFRGFETALSRYLATVDIPLSQFYILRLNWEECGHQQNDIAERACMTESVASQVIQKMVKSGLLARQADAEDARKRLVVLTEKGQSLRRKIAKEGIAISTKNAPKISKEDMKTTISVLMEIKKGFDIYNNKR